MDVQKTGIITMLCNALTESNYPLPADFDWEALSSEPSRYKNLRGLLIRGANLAGIPRSHPAIRELMIGFLEDIRRSRNQMQQLQAVYDVFDAQGVDYMPVKGAILKTMYPQPELRMMEDADILIRTEQLPTIRKIMLEMDMEERSGDTNESIWNHPKLLLELHKTLISSQFGEFLDYLHNSWDFAEKEPKGNAYRFREENHFIFLVIHFAKHYMHGSTSPKDICDLWVFRNAYAQMDEQYIKAELQRVNLAEFYKNILAVLNAWFRGAEFTAQAELITDSVFQHGTVDNTASQWSHMILSNQDSTHSLGKTKCKFILQKIFPPRRSMQVRYPILMKKPWLTPIYRFRRWFEILFLKKRPDHAMDVLIKGDVLQEYTDHLNQVGLGKASQK